MQGNNSLDAKELIIKLKQLYNMSSDIQLCRKLGIKPNTLSTWKVRNSVDFKLIISKCDDLDFNYLFKGHLKNESSKDRKDLKRLNKLEDKLEELKAEIKQIKGNEPSTGVANTSLAEELRLHIESLQKYYTKLVKLNKTK